MNNITFYIIAKHYEHMVNRKEKRRIILLRGGDGCAIMYTTREMTQYIGYSEVHYV